MTEASAPIEAHTDEAQTPPSVFDVAVIGSGPAGSQSAVSAAHQTRSVLVIEAGAVSQRKGRAFWSKSVEFQDAPVFPGITGPRLATAFSAWMSAQVGRMVTIGGKPR